MALQPGAIVDGVNIQETPVEGALKVHNVQLPCIPRHPDNKISRRISKKGLWVCVGGMWDFRQGLRVEGPGCSEDGMDLKLYSSHIAYLE